MNIEGFLKGRMAETLVEELLRSSGNKVYRFGYEAVTQNLSQSQFEEEFKRDSEVGQQIKTIPDFIVINKKGEPAFVEVKFRRDGKFHKYDSDKIDSLKKIWKAKLIIVNCLKSPYFQIASPPYSDFVDLFNPEFKSLWNINKDSYNECEKLVLKYLVPICKKEEEEKEKK